MKRNYLFLWLFTASVTISFAQQIDYYNLIVEEDTFSLGITAEELAEAEIDRKLKLDFISEYKTKAIRFSENISGDLKLKGDSVIYSVLIYDYFDEYMISFLGVSEPLSKKEYLYEPIRFQRIRYEDIEWVITSGKKKFIPQFIAGTAIMAGGATLTILPIADLFIERRNTFPIWMIPIGLAVTYIGYRIIEPVMIRTFLFENWDLEVVSR